MSVQAVPAQVARVDGEPGHERRGLPQGSLINGLALLSGTDKTS
jgi:hypothetical protein